MPNSAPPDDIERIAIIGLAGRFAGARDLDQFWDNLRHGRTARRELDAEALALAGVPRTLAERPDWVRAAYVLDDATAFDASYFGYSPREAELLDPQQRVLLECAVAALESAGYDPGRSEAAIALYGSTSASSYLLQALLRRRELLEEVGSYGLMLANDKDYLATRIAHRLGLRGPAITVQTACSSSLVAVHLAAQSLLGGECEIALAGGVSIGFPQQSGYLYQDGMIQSPDGYCRAFDEKAHGTVRGAGAGLIVLKRLSDAVRDRDTIHAVIAGSAVNNDGSAKVSYTAPSVQGQTAVIAEALDIAGVSPDQVQYIEAHGTGTSLGDPIEVAALNQVFGGPSASGHRCALGALKANIGHLDAAAGIAGLIKTVLALVHREIPPTPHFTTPNPRIDFAGGPFYVAAALAPWPAAPGATRHAGVSSFGIGGTNAHVVLREAPVLAASAAPARDDWQLLVLSAAHPAALEQATTQLREHLERHPQLALADVAYTLQAGRAARRYRRLVLARDRAEAIAALADPTRRLDGDAESERSVVFLLPGQGAQHVAMGRGLYERDPVFRRSLDTCCERLRPWLGRDLRELLYPTQDPEERQAELKQTHYAQPALFAVSYALAESWAALGVTPAAMLGHSLGEYVAACLAGVWTLEQALSLVATRGQLMQALPPGTMLSVSCAAAALAPLLPAGVAIAAENAPALAVAAGPEDAIAQLETTLASRGIAARRLHTSHAFHSAMMDPVLAPFAQAVARSAPEAPRRAYVSNLTGAWITPELATDPKAWAAHLRQPVRFAQGAALLLEDPARVFLEVGPGNTLATLLRQCTAAAGQALPPVLASLPQPREAAADELRHRSETAGRLWLLGASIDLAALHGDQPRRRVPLPTYPFQHQRYDLLETLPPGSQTVSQGQGQGLPGMLIPGGSGPEPGRARHARPPLATPLVAARNDTEERIAALWQALLGIEQVGVLDNFFELGGHSLLGTQVLARLREDFQVDLDVRTLFESPTVEGMALAVLAARAQEVDPALLEALLADLEPSA